LGATNRTLVRWVRDNDCSKDIAMAWTTPTLVEICVGLEINGYLPAEF
jgi:coenzyme PQQ precursor peptide PqqA